MTCPSACRHKELLFDKQGCLRYDQSTCQDKSSPFYAVASNGLDALILRLAEESKLMSVYNTSALGPQSSG